MNRARPQRRGILSWSIAVILLGLPAISAGDDEVPPNRVGGVFVNYVYAAQFGLGGYQLDELSVRVLNLPLRYTLTVDDPTRDGEQTWEVKLHFPLKYGRYTLDGTEADGTVIDEVQETVAVVPGIELVIPLKPNWTLKPMASFGVGRAFLDDSDWVYIYGLGARHRYELPWRGFTLLAGNSLQWAGNATFGGTAKEAFGTLQTGIGARHALGFDVRGWEPDLEGFFNHHHFFPSAEFARVGGETLRLRNQYEFGASLGRVGPWRLWFLKNPRIGLSFRFGDGMQGLRIHTGFPF